MKQSGRIAGRLAAGGLGVAALAAGLLLPAQAQQGARTVRQSAPPTVDPAGTVDWPLHNLDVRNTRYAQPDQIDTSNVGSLELKWVYEMPPREIVRSTTPLVIDGVMYFNNGSKLTALNATTGETVWTFEGDPAFPGGGRGPAYADGVIYAFGPEILYAVDARTGELVESFGGDGLLQVAREALTFKYPDTYPPTVDTTAMGFAMTNPPTSADGTLFVGLPFSEGLLPGGLLAALDGSTGAMRWVFNTVPQGPQDSGWEIANGTWSSDKRYGGGVWMQPAIDTELGMVYINAANPSPNYDGSSRLGMNLFTNSMLAVDIETGELAWYFQTLHHDIWDWDLASGPILFDVTVDGRPVKAVASLGKTCYVYILDRATGEPLNPIVETTVPRNTDVPGEEVWPTQPVPYNTRGVPQEPFCATYPTVADPELVPRARQIFHPYQVNEFCDHVTGQHRRRELRLVLVQPAHRPAVRDRQERRLVHQGEGGRRHPGAGPGLHRPLRQHRRARRHRHDPDLNAGRLRSGHGRTGLARRERGGNERREPGDRGQRGLPGRRKWQLLRFRRGDGRAGVRVRYRARRPRQPAHLSGERHPVRRDCRGERGARVRPALEPWRTPARSPRACARFYLPCASRLRAPARMLTIA